MIWKKKNLQREIFIFIDEIYLRYNKNILFLFTGR